MGEDYIDKRNHRALFRKFVTSEVSIKQRLKLGLKNKWKSSAVVRIVYYLRIVAFVLLKLQEIGYMRVLVFGT